MKSNLYLLMLICILLLASCKNNNDVVSNSLLQKRKYQKGWYTEKFSGHLADSKKEKDKNQADNALLTETKQQENEAYTIAADASIEAGEIIVTKPVYSKRAINGDLSLRKADNSPETKVNADDHTELLKKKKKKKKRDVTLMLQWGYLFAVLSTWFWGWEFVTFLNIPVLGIIFGTAAILICTVGLFKLKKVKRKGLNILIGVAGILFGLFSLLICIALL